DVTISGNYFGRLSTEAVKADGSSNGILVSGNIIADLEDNIVNAINLGGAADCLVKDNLLRKQPDSIPSEDTKSLYPNWNNIGSLGYYSQFPNLRGSKMNGECQCEGVW